MSHLSLVFHLWENPAIFHLLSHISHVVEGPGRKKGLKNFMRIHHCGQWDLREIKMYSQWWSSSPLCLLSTGADYRCYSKVCSCGSAIYYSMEDQCLSAVFVFVTTNLSIHRGTLIYIMIRLCLNIFNLTYNVYCFQYPVYMHPCEHQMINNGYLHL